MMAFPSMLVDAAKKAKMSVPKDPDSFDANKYPHFHVFCQVQLCRPIKWGEHWENAEIIAKISNDKIKKITLCELLDLGLHYQQ